MSEREKIYDEQIAPLLLQAAKLSEEHKMPIVAQVEWDHGEYGLTAYVPEESSWAMRILLMAAKAKTNVDALFMGIKRLVGDDVGNSFVLRLLSNKARI